MTETKTEQPKVTVNFSWWIPWSCGFLFTIGFVPISGDLANLVWYERAGVFVLSFVFWPATLGQYLQTLISPH